MARRGKNRADDVVAGQEKTTNYTPVNRIM